MQWKTQTRKNRSRSLKFFLQPSSPTEEPTYRETADCNQDLGLEIPGAQNLGSGESTTSVLITVVFVLTMCS